MFRSCLLATLVTMTACNGNDEDGVLDGGTVGDTDTDTDSDTDSDTDTDTDADCDTLVASVDPADGADLVPLDSDVVVTFDAALPSGGAWSIDVVGETGTATLALDNLSATWSPTTTLSPETTITVQAEVCGVTASSSFETLPPPVDPALVPAATFVLLWSDLTFTEPGFANYFQIPIDLMLLELGTIDLATLEVDATSAVGTDNGGGKFAPVCESAVTGSASFELNPYLKFGPEDLTFVVDVATGTMADAEDFTLTARVLADGSALTDVRVRTMVAPEQINDAIDCQTAAVLAMGTCVPCTVSASGDCLLIEGSAPSADLAPGIDIIDTCGL